MRLPFLPLIALASLVAFSVTAEERMDAESFERYTTGQTLRFSAEGVPYGMEQYLPGRRVLWAFLGDQCQEGIWYERDELICFVYDDNPVEQCWSFYRGENGLRAVFEGGDGPGTELYEVERSSDPLSCSAPEVGV
ncbi:MAG: hypothetical protein HLUCCA12_02770 [Rhodobacteraceae bacterium HLUCCA12]|nr:MAG: hypothetical protein HLUCCA12_02770 [Rhodobacteraceae bacterium HLUCCA12]